MQHKNHTATGLLRTYLLFSPVVAGGVDCGNMTSIVERAICHDPEVLALDAQLAQSIQHKIDTHPDKQGEIMSDERHWFTHHRDARCESYEKQGINADAVLKMHGCLNEVYHTRLTEVGAAEWPKSPPPPQTKVADASMCNKLLDRYRPLASAHPGDPPMAALTNNGRSGVRAAVGEAVAGSEALDSWGKQQKPPVAIEDAVSEAIGDSGGLLEHVPEAPFYMLGRTQGSMRCDDSVYFVIHEGVAEPSQSPYAAPGDGDGGGYCDTSSGSLVSLDSKPLYIREVYDRSPNPQASLSVATWHADHFEPACTVSLVYQLKVTGQKSTWGEEQCQGADCADMRQDALQLVQQKLFADFSEEARLKSLTRKQRESYQAAEAVAEQTGDGHASENVGFVPFVFKGEVYVARVADVSYNVWDLADQSVKFEQLEDGQIVDKAVFSFEVVKADLVDGSTETVP